MGKKVKMSSTRMYLSVLVLLLILAAVTSILSGSQRITGAATTQTTTASVTINAAPTVIQVGPIASQTITEAGTTSLLVRFNVTDDAGGIDNSTGYLQINITPQTNGTTNFRINSSCSNVSMVTLNITQFECTANLWYFNSPGNWSINVSAKDTSGVIAQNKTTTFELQQATAFVIGPTALTWAALELGQANRTSNNDPITLNNTGNKNIGGTGATGGISIRGKDLRGLTNAAEHIGVANFSVWWNSGNSTCNGVNCTECNGTQPVNGSTGANVDVLMAIANLTRGNNTMNSLNETSGQEEIYFCLKTVASEISRQTYDTTGYGSWVVSVS